MDSTTHPSILKLIFSHSVSVRGILYPLFQLHIGQVLVCGVGVGRVTLIMCLKNAIPYLYTMQKLFLNLILILTKVFTPSALHRSGVGGVGADDLRFHTSPPQYQPRPFVRFSTLLVQGLVTRGNLGSTIFLASKVTDLTYIFHMNYEFYL